MTSAYKYFLFISLGFCLVARAESRGEAMHSLFDLARGGIYFTSYFQSDSSNSNSAFLFWSPGYHLTESLNLNVDLGATYLNTPALKFFVFHFAGRLGFKLVSNLSLEITAGTQDWTNEAGFMTMAGGGLAYRFSERLLNCIETVRAAGQFIDHKEFPTWQFLIGIEFSLGGNP